MRRPGSLRVVERTPMLTVQTAVVVGASVRPDAPGEKRMAAARPLSRGAAAGLPEGRSKTVSQVRSR